MSDPIVRQDRVVLTKQELDALDAMLKAGDRAAFYLTYNAMTDNAEAFLQAKVALRSPCTLNELLPARGNKFPDIDLP